MTDILHRVGIRAPQHEVYRAIATTAGVAGWWTEETTGDSTVGGTVKVRFTDRGVEKGRMDCEVRELVPEERVRWHVTAGPEEWIGTDITFDLSRDGDFTLVLFGHRGWREPGEFMAHCSTKWAVFLLSLRELVETGKGKPSPRDVKIDNWN